MGDLGFGFDKSGAKWGGVVDVLDPALQTAITDCAHLRPQHHDVDEGGGEARCPSSRIARSRSSISPNTPRASRRVRKARHSRHLVRACLGRLPACAPGAQSAAGKGRARDARDRGEAFAMVRDYKGSHSGEHGDGIVRSEFHQFMFGSRLVRAFEEVKTRFDPKGLFNPGKIVQAPRFDDRGNFRYGPDYRGEEIATRLDWSAWPGAGGGFQGAVEMCNNNGACRKMAGGVMCPELSRHPRRKRCHARPREQSAACGHRSARTGRARFARDGGDDEAVRVLQGLPARMPDRASTWRA
jgi:hypothetical protein